MSRERSFCAYCGTLTTRLPDHDGRTRCHAHTGLELDARPRPVVKSEPMGRRAPLCRACYGSGRVHPGVECSNCDGQGRHPAQTREGKVT